MSGFFVFGWSFKLLRPFGISQLREKQLERKERWARELLLFIEQFDSEGSGLHRKELREMFVSSYSGTADLTEIQAWNALDYHLHLIETAGFVKVTADDKDHHHDNFELTWAGHDYLSLQP